jgi:hypothetical protein
VGAGREVDWTVVVCLVIACVAWFVSSCVDYLTFPLVLEFGLVEWWTVESGS